jgi:hypothetical protein
MRHYLPIAQLDVLAKNSHISIENRTADPIHHRVLPIPANPCRHRLFETITSRDPGARRFLCRKYPFH